MRLVVPFAAGLSDAAAQALQTLHLPQLERLLGRLSLAEATGGDEYALNPPHEQVRAALHGWNTPDGQVPLAAAAARADGVPVPAGDAQGWGLLTPAHWQVGREQILMRDPDELALAADESKALFAGVHGLFASAGWELHWGAPQRWYARHASLAALATASLDRVVGRNLDLWLPDRLAGRQVRRLQSEVQMLWHGHPINQAREARGAQPVNSFWLSGTGRPAPEAADAAVAWDERLRAPFLAERWDAWADAWHALDRERLAPLEAQAARGAPVSITLCGERVARTFTAAPRGLWQRLAGRWRRVPAAAVLDGL